MRRHDWPERLTAVFVASRGRVFAFGEHDCCTFAADCVEAVIGRDVAAAWRGNYDSWNAGMRLAKAGSMSALARRFFKPIPTAMAWRGDVAVVRIGREFGLAVFDGAALRGPAGGIAPRRDAIRAYRVE